MKKKIAIGDNEDYSGVFNKQALRLLCPIFLAPWPCGFLSLQSVVQSLATNSSLQTAESLLAELLGAHALGKGIVREYIWCVLQVPSAVEV